MGRNFILLNDITCQITDLIFIFLIYLFISLLTNHTFFATIQVPENLENRPLLSK